MEKKLLLKVGFRNNHLTNRSVISGIVIGILSVLLSSCTVLEKASSHGFESGTYSMQQKGKDAMPVYAETSENEISVYLSTEDKLSSEPIKVIPLGTKDSICHIPVSFSKHSLDIDITTVLFKVRPAAADIPLQMTSDFNAAMYAGWRYDTYRVDSRTTPTGKCEYRMINRGFDLGMFAGVGTTPVNPFFTANKVQREYSAMIVEYGVAAFVESSVASFGLAAGADLMTGPDRKHWIYRNRPWLGFIIGVALN